MSKKILGTFSLFVVAMAFIFSPAAFAQNKFYLGAGMGYHMDAFNAEMDSDNSYGFNFTLGYDISKHVSLEAQFDKINEMGTKNPVSYEDADLKGYSLNMKYYPAAAKDRVNGYLLIGLGWMEAEASNDIDAKSSDKEEDLWGKIGVGSDFVVTDKISFYLEADYAQGFNDLNPLDYYSAKIGFKIYP